MIKNATDQIDLYAHEISKCVKYLVKEEGYTQTQAIKIVEIAVEDIKAEVMHQETLRKNGGYDYMGILPTVGESLMAISSQLEKLEEINLNVRIEKETE